MIIKMGYVSHSISLWDASPARTLTFTRYNQLSDVERAEKLLEVTRKNLESTIRMVHYNIAHNIPLYRMSSSLVPLATHPEVRWDFVAPFREEWRKLGDLVKAGDLRTSFHPSQFTLFTSPHEDVTDNAVIDMEYHYQMLEAMGLEDEAVINIHIGGAYGNKEETLPRFHENLRKLPPAIKKRMTLENDDKTYNSDETLAVCEKEGIPFVFDIHHHLANRGEKSLEELIPACFATWKNIGLRPKIHISSPKSDKAYRSHSDFVDPDYIKPLLDVLKKIGQDADFMIEAKLKDQAVLKLAEDLNKVRGIKRVGGTIIEL
ncbi:UV DNA damage repair endonuclease UvsE [Mesobacillus zeae]|uniref:UV DNA damage endonuclease n=1 Tax=Mesobacillus zeae TaxID=1917180 RepID=A0A398BDH2_9BACI|nr:UV DNA damage repair endonuclease UvsE [Mesobacillus zeae]RID86868.1 UV DNA damage repair endonuclease UvsE [Mesobacillus zeae]